MATYDYIGGFDFDQLDAAHAAAGADEGLDVYRVDCGVRVASGGDEVPFAAKCTT